MATENYPTVKNWAVDALCVNPEDPTGMPVPTCNLQIPVNDRSVIMPGSKIHAGMPVDANLAVKYIRNFLNNFKIRVTEPHTHAKSLASAGKAEELYEIVKEHKKFHDSLLKMTYGMTVEKDMALRILSKPKCEGLRFYLCAKQLKPEDDWNMSLIVVGVNEKGVDLHYDLKDTIKPYNSQMTDGEDYNTQSLTGEYVTPPYDDDDGGNSSSNLHPLLRDKEDVIKKSWAKDFYNCFVLLNLAKKTIANR
ncbi:MAG TPA: hypothetical protein VGC01_08570 [Mucilaginibacter sp.]